MSKFIVQTFIEAFPQTTISSLDIGEGHFCWVLEDTIRPYGIKVPKFTAIPLNPQGYRLRVRYSPSFKREMLMLYTPSRNHPANDTISLNGVTFRFVYVHGGNTHKHTNACPLVAFNRDGDTIWGSAEETLVKIVKGWMEKEEVHWIKL